MKSIFFFQLRQKSLYAAAFFSLILPVLLLLIGCQNGQAQQTQLGLADILIALRSKKAALVQKNEILTEAVKQRGITFTLTTQIETELRGNGASVELIEAMQQKSPAPPVISTPKPTPPPTPIPVPTPTLPDAAFYQKRADDYLAKGEYERAIADYNESLRLNSQDAAVYYSRGFAYHYKADQTHAFEDYKTAAELKPELALQPLMQCVFYKSGQNQNPDKAIENCSKTIAASANFALVYFIRGNAYLDKRDNDQAILNYNKTVELNPKYAAAYLNRGQAFFDKQDYVIAIADYTKVIELDPKISEAFINRADCYEKKGKLQEAVNDYQKVVDLGGNNQSAKYNLQRIQLKQLGAMSRNDKPATPVLTVQSETKQTADIGELNSRAVKLQTPIFPQDARRLGVQGKVIVQITINETGEVTSAKTTSGNALLRNSAEDAARKSKFKPLIVSNQPIKATGYIVYNYVKP